MELVLCSLWLSRRYFGGDREGGSEGGRGGGHKTVDWTDLLRGVREGTFRERGSKGETGERRGWSLARRKERGMSLLVSSHGVPTLSPPSLPPSTLPNRPSVS